MLPYSTRYGIVNQTGKCSKTLELIFCNTKDAQYTQYNMTHAHTHTHTPTHPHNATHTHTRSGPDGFVTVGTCEVRLLEWAVTAIQPLVLNIQ